VSVHVHIERLVLDGVDLGPGDDRRLAASLASELERLLASDPGSAERLAQGGALPSLSAADVDLGAPGGARGAGKSIARSLSGALSGPQKGGER
jgi:hypothetical protein